MIDWTKKTCGECTALRGERGDMHCRARPPQPMVLSFTEVMATPQEMLHGGPSIRRVPMIHGVYPPRRPEDPACRDGFQLRVDLQ